MYKLASLLIFLTVASMQVALCQSVSTDSLFYQRSLKASRNSLTDTLEKGLSLYNGIEHPGYYRGIKGFAYLDSEEMTEGRVKYDNVWYDIPMLYDLYSDKLVITHFNRFHRIFLINEKVQEFVLHDRLFRNLSVAETSSLSGLCEVLYEGDSISVYAKKKKLLNERSTSQGLERDFINSNQYYMKVNGAYHTVKSKGDMFGLMGDKRKDVVVELRKRKIKFRKNKEKALVIAAEIYDNKI